MNDATIYLTVPELQKLCVIASLMVAHDKNEVIAITMSGKSGIGNKIIINVRGHETDITDYGSW